jgi:Transposase domain (DUF772).
MIQPGFFDLQDRLHKIDKNGDPLTRINEIVNWEMFRPALEKARDKGPKSNVGAKGYDVILLFKILILQSLYNMSDNATEFRYSTVTPLAVFSVCTSVRRCLMRPRSGFFGKT